MKKETDTKPIFRTKLRFAPRVPIKKRPMPSRIVPVSIKEASTVADLFQNLKITKTNPDFGMGMSKMEKEVGETDTKSASIAKRTTNTKEEPFDADLVECLTKLRFMPNIFARKKPALSKIDSTNIKESIDADLLDCLKIPETNAGFFMRMSKSEDKVKEINTKSAPIAKLFAAKIPHKKFILPKIGSTNIKEEPTDVDFLLCLKTSKTNASFGLGRRILKTGEKVKAHAEQISFGATICDVSGSFAGLSLSKMDKEDDQLNFCMDFETS